MTLLSNAEKSRKNNMEESPRMNLRASFGSVKHVMLRSGNCKKGNCKLQVDNPLPPLLKGIENFKFAFCNFIALLV
jgi:hypothetical protein